MRIVIDMQGIQTESRFRGIGRFSMAFTKAILKNRGNHEIIIALSGLFPATIKSIRTEFNDYLPQENIRVWYAPGPVNEATINNDSRRQVAELIREAFLANLKPDLIHISSLFEGFQDDAVTSIGTFDNKIPISVTLYDLIPLLNPIQYLDSNPQYSIYYKRKINYLNKASIYLAISDYSMKEGIQYLHKKKESFITITGAVDSYFMPLNLKKSEIVKLLEKFGISHPFILYTGGSDQRKNLSRLIQSYALLPKKIRENHQLVFAGNMSKEDVFNFGKIAQNFGLRINEIKIIGYVNDDDIVKLYNLCHLYIFPSWHEGFGLTVLEAMACGAPVIGSNASSIPEVLNYDDALFDPLDVNSILDKLEHALCHNDFREKLRKHGLKQAKLFSWDKSAKEALKAWSQLTLSKND